MLVARGGAGVFYRPGPDFYCVYSVHDVANARPLPEAKKRRHTRTAAVALEIRRCKERRPRCSVEVLVNVRDCTSYGGPIDVWFPLWPSPSSARARVLAEAGKATVCRAPAVFDFCVWPGLPVLFSERLDTEASPPHATSGSVVTVSHH